MPILKTGGLDWTEMSSFIDIFNGLYLFLGNFRAPFSKSFFIDIFKGFYLFFKKFQSTFFTENLLTKPFKYEP